MVRCVGCLKAAPGTRSLGNIRQTNEEEKRKLQKHLRDLENQLKQMEQDNLYPQKPVVHPVTLYIREKLAMNKGMPGLGSGAASKEILDPKTVYVDSNREWKDGTIPEPVKEKYRLRAEKNKKDHEAALKKWYGLYQYSRTLERMEKLREELKAAKRRVREASSDGS